MERRELLKMIAILTGSAVVGGDIFLSGCTVGTKTDAGFTSSSITLLYEIGETIIPATTTPGAKAAQIGEFMKVIVTDCYTMDEQKVFLDGLNNFESVCKQATGKTFTSCSAQEKHDFLITLEKEAKEYNKKVSEKDKPTKEAFEQKGKSYDFVASPRHYYTMLKQLTLWGFFSSKTGMTETLQHNPVPGSYNGAVAYQKGDKAWAE